MVIPVDIFTILEVMRWYSSVASGPNSASWKVPCVKQRAAFLYPRVSTDDQADGYSPAHQEDALQRHCVKENIIVKGVFHEDYSAKTFERPEFNRMLSIIKKQRNTVDLFLITKWDRFSRNFAEAYRMIGVLKKLGVEVQAIEQPLDMEIPESKIMLAIYLTAPEVENDRRALNTLHGMRRAKKEGRYLGIAPRGYSNGRDAENKPILVPNKDMATVKWCFEEMSREIFDIQTLWRMARQKGLKVQKSQFWSMLRNPVYCGKVFIAAYKNEPAHCVAGIHPPIISEHLFNEVQDVLRGRRRKVRIDAKHHITENLPLRGFLICKNCGQPLTGSGSKGNGGVYYYYHCMTARKCNERFRASEANEAFIRVLQTIAVNGDVLCAYAAKVHKALEKGQTSDKSEIVTIDDAISKIGNRLQNARTLLLDGELSMTDYNEIKTNLLGEQQALTARKHNLQQKPKITEDYMKAGGDILANIATRFAAANSEGKKKIIGSIFPGKLIFQENKVRTTEPNVILELIGRMGKDLDGSKKEKVGEISNLSASVPRTGIEPAHPFEYKILSLARLPIPPSGQCLSHCGMQMYVIK